MVIINQVALGFYPASSVAAFLRVVDGSGGPIHLDPLGPGLLPAPPHSLPLSHLLCVPGPSFSERRTPAVGQPHPEPAGSLATSKGFFCFSEPQFPLCTGRIIEFS